MQIPILLQKIFLKKKPKPKLKLKHRYFIIKFDEDSKSKHILRIYLVSILKTNGPYSIV